MDCEGEWWLYRSWAALSVGATAGQAAGRQDGRRLLGATDLECPLMVGVQTQLALREQGVSIVPVDA
jgi:hypothetical protein